MPIVDGKYVAPTWVNKGAPPISATELQAMCDTIASNQTAVSTAQETADDAQTTADGKYTKPSAGIPKSDLASDVQTALTGNAKIVTGTYTGTGTYGTDNPNSLTFDFEPKLVFIASSTETNVAMIPYIWGSAAFRVAGSGSGSVLNTVTVSGNTMSWYCKSAVAYQMNASGEVYNYIAIF